MNKNEFMQRLRKRLARLPHDEYNDAVEYYEQYFAEAEDEQVAIRQLGSPDAVAAKILADYADTPTDNTDWKKLWIVICAIFAAPIALPVAIALVVTIVSLGVSLLAVSFSVMAAGVVVFISGIAATLLSFFFIAESIPTMLLLMGCGLVCTSIGLIMIYSTVWLVKKCVLGSIKLVGNLLRRSSAK
ncbi:MAG: DUF1700 domain-containing protein [Dehalococcoidia bacterium]|nr:DUF1700 domain-containing protein [Dehalococcoidia bacterium]